MCAAANNNLLACGSNNDWANGWIIFTDPNNTGTVPNTANRLKVHDSLDTGSQITTTSARVTYNAAGYAISGAGVFNLTATGCLGNNGRQLTITNYGRTDIVNTGC
jgi:Tfp pilus assembly protein FimT